MNIGQQIRKITGSGAIKQGCKFDHSNGSFRCEKRRVNEDHTEEVLGSISGQLDGGCNVVIDEQFENEEGALESLNKNFIDNIRGKCASKPSDY
ncbi:MAG TPA: hypothetical protein VGB37_14595 [Candidatus Lokiarchaeia archaeon]